MEETEINENMLPLFVLLADEETLPFDDVEENDNDSETKKIKMK